MMDWKPVEYQDEASHFDDHLSSVLSQEREPLPASIQNFGHVRIQWSDEDLSRAYIEASGGTVDDRFLTSSLLMERLAAFGYRRYNWEIDGEAMRRTADWNDDEDDCPIFMEKDS